MAAFGTEPDSHSPQLPIATNGHKRPLKTYYNYLLDQSERATDVGLPISPSSKSDGCPDFFQALKVMGVLTFFKL